MQVTYEENVQWVELTASQCTLDKVECILGMLTFRSFRGP